MTADRAVELQDIGHRFGDVEVLRGLSASIETGHVACLVGPNGSGKTTLLRIVAGLLEPTSGEVVLGAPVDGARDRQIGYLPQHPAFRPAFTVRETLSFYADLVPGGTEVEDRLAQVGLADVADRRIDALSGGMVRLLGIAQTVVGSPSLLVLDEPASGLDPTMSRRVTGAIEDLGAAGDTVLLATHDLSALERVADDVLVLDRGRIVAAGPPPTLLAATGTDSLADAFDELTAGDVASVVAGVGGDAPAGGVGDEESASDVGDDESASGATANATGRGDDRTVPGSEADTTGTGGEDGDTGSGSEADATGTGDEDGDTGSGSEAEEADTPGEGDDCHTEGGAES